ncbi:porin family protein [Inquilinus sp. KBS0705]|nr:porin family protein [Inquilinus sp. KBS0705]
MPKFLTALLLLFIALNANAQTWEIGGGAGAAGYIGDLNANPVKPSGASGGVFVKRNFNGYLGLKLNYALGQIGADDAKSSIEQFRNRNLSFTDPLKELSILLEFNFMKYIPDAGHNRYTPYVYIGGGLASYNPRTIFNGQTIYLRWLRTEGQTKEYSKNAIVIPYGAGIKYNLGGKWTVAADVGYRYTNTDFLDDVSGVYAAHDKLPFGPSVKLADRSGEKTGVYIGTPGSQRGDFRAKDIYMFAGFTISYTFVTEKCYFEQ